ncbi:MAG TPA: ABC transporter ATP-binding protein [Bacteroidota bacterium]|nr:ABC transporter ATP-binding protein [Bacteroidota bacterium]
MSIQLQAEGLAKTFNRRTIFSGISLSLREGESLAVTGRNGSGKSTLLKIISGVLSPSRGRCFLKIDDREVPAASSYTHLGFVSPYLQLYDEFSGIENLELFTRIRGHQVPRPFIEALLERVNLAQRSRDQVRTYSSGMKQRLKYAFALLHNPQLLLLDEPTSNLDSEGMATVYQIMEEQVTRGILIIATNDAEDLKRTDRVLDLNSLAAEKGAATP